MRKFFVLFFVVVLFSFTPFLFAQIAPAKRPMTFEDMMQMKRLGETAVSADGKWLAYSVTSVDLAANSRIGALFLQAIAPSTSEAKVEPIPVAATMAGDSGLQFAPDGKSILFLSGRGGSQQIWTADFDSATGATTNPRKLSSIATEADNALWSPDGKTIVFTSDVYPDCPVITTADAKTGDKCNSDRDLAAATSKVKAQIFDHLLYRHWNHYTGPKRSHLFELTVAAGALRDLNPNDTHDVPPFSLGGGGGFAFAPDSKELAFTENLSDQPALSTSAGIFTLDLTNPAAKPVKVSTSAGGNFNPAYSPDGKYLAWRSQARAGYESDKFRLMLYDREKKTEKDLLPKFDNWVDEFVWSADSTKILFISSETGEAPIVVTDLNGKTQVQPFLGEFSELHITGRSEQVIATRMTIDKPSEAVRFNHIWYAGHCFSECDNGQLTPWSSLTYLNDALLKQLDFSELDGFYFKANDGTNIQGFILKPPALSPNKKYPVKFLIHGGPQGAWGDSWSYRWNAELFAANGYVVIMINPRGSTGYGQAFVEGVSGDWGGKPFTDLMEGLDYAEQHFPFIDKNRECALGASYGGYMANWILGHTNRFKCIVTHDGMFNAESAFGATEEMWFNTWEFKGTPWDYYGKPDSENPFRKWSPSLSVKNFKTPTLVVHGQLDYRLDVSEGFQLFTALQMRNVPSKMLYFPDEGHWVLKPQNSQLWYKTVNDWVDQWTKP
jgi:dipeptidyl aminopeptidase/acylaminoacyl peptidase